MLPLLKLVEYDDVETRETSKLYIRQVREDDVSYVVVDAIKKYHCLIKKCDICKSKAILECACYFNVEHGGYDDKPVEIYPRIYLGSSYYLKKDEFLQKNNIGYILNCAYPSLLDNLSKNEYNSSLEKLTLNAYDDTDYPIIDLFGDLSFDFVYDALINSSKNIFIHCQMGYNRSAIIASYIIWKLKNNTEDICKIICNIIRLRPFTFSNKFFIRHSLGTCLIQA